MTRHNGDDQVNRLGLIFLTREFIEQTHYFRVVMDTGLYVFVADPEGCFVGF